MYAKKRLFSLLILLTFIAGILVTSLVWYFTVSRIVIGQQILLGLFGIIFAGFLLIFTFGLMGIFIPFFRRKPLPLMRECVFLTSHLFFPIAMLLGKLAKGNKDKIEQSFIALNNRVTRLVNTKIPPGKVLLLLPHCLQKHDCMHKVTVDIKNCRECGRCTIGEIKNLVQEYGINAMVVTGGTLARKAIRELKPMAIVAVACERDLTSGIQDISPLPVLGVLNLRPEGPCFNTMVEIDKLRESIEYFLYNKQNIKE